MLFHRFVIYRKNLVFFNETDEELHKIVKLRKTNSYETLPLLTKDRFALSIVTDGIFRSLNVNNIICTKFWEGTNIML